MLQRYGHLNKWVGFNDIDEFFLPAKIHREILLQRLSKYYYHRGDSLEYRGVLLDVLENMREMHHKVIIISN